MITRPRYPKLVIAILAFASGVFMTALVVWNQGPFVLAHPARAVGVARVATPAEPPPAPEGTSGRAVAIPTEFADRDLVVPVEGVERDALVNTFDDPRGGGRRHEAIDILAPRNTPVLAVEDGVIARLFRSDPGGLTIYQFDPTREYVYYYAHLDGYAEALNEGDRVRRGQVIGYVGTTGNAPRNTPHLHFAIFKLTDEKRWWEGTPIDPYEILRKVR
ncbi:MAG TPA: M23 family metallopeptidase [Vicinamibacterales bacterium]|nr:M23 family metallopeptidase [Vicinamibacterales bacterium]